MILDAVFLMLNDARGVVPPEPLPGPAFTEVMRRLYTQEMREAGIEGSVRVVLSIDAHGRVTGARATRLPSRPFVRAEESGPILIDGTTGQRLPAPPAYTNDVQLWRIAEEAARAQRFSPATHRGKPVRYRRYVMSVGFGGSGGDSRLSTPRSP